MTQQSSLNYCHAVRPKTEDALNDHAWCWNMLRPLSVCKWIIRIPDLKTQNNLCCNNGISNWNKRLFVSKDRKECLCRIVCRLAMRTVSKNATTNTSKRFEKQNKRMKRWIADSQVEELHACTVTRIPHIWANGESLVAIRRHGRPPHFLELSPAISNSQH